ncbi:MAG: type II toxin-antitoxin system PemK/MazF family toxin [Clostridiales bacterium]|nr:type II toxin-antitoxin system PemK/MazF family toxin [Clostridiales bacterium]
MKIRRGDIVLADLNPVIGSEQGGSRPVLVIQNDIGNKYSPTVIIAAITACVTKTKMPTHVVINQDIAGLSKDSVVLTEQIRTIDKKRLLQKIGILPIDLMQEVDKALYISLGLYRKEN